MKQDLWERAVEFHGHECPGLAIGFRACEAVQEKMGFSFSKDEEIVCVTENDACGVDAVQVLTGCTFGKGNLIYRGTGKMAFSFYSRASGARMRVVLKPTVKEMDRKKCQAYLLTAPIEDIFKFTDVSYELPEMARLFDTVICSNCGEGAPEHKMRLQNGQAVCLDCFKAYDRGY